MGVSSHAPFFYHFWLLKIFNMKKILETAITAAHLAGEFIQTSAENLSLLNVEQKTLHDYVSEVDRGSEKIVVDQILATFPDHQILGEEYGSQGNEGAQWQWVIDPLDGTTNFLRSLPHYAVSIGVLKGGVVHYGVVYDPAKKDLFVASKGEGATLNNVAIKVSSSDSIKGGLLATGVPFSGQNLDNIESFTNTMTDLLKCQTSGVRRLGAAALDLAYVAAGRYDGFWESNLKVWDIAAGVLIVEEAGGIVTDLSGGNDYLNNGDVLAAAKNVHQDMLLVCKKHY